VRRETSRLHAESARACLISSYPVFSATLFTLILRPDGNAQYSASAPDLHLGAALQPEHAARLETSAWP
jgi:hypothetical protein